MIIGLLSLAKVTGGKFAGSFGISRFFAKSRPVGEWVCLQNANPIDRPDMGQSGSTIDLHGIGAENESADPDGAHGYADEIPLTDLSYRKIPRRGPTILTCMIEALSKMPSS